MLSVDHLNIDAGAGQVVDSKKMKARLDTLTGAEVAELRRIVVGLAMVGSGMAKAGPGDPWTWKPTKRSSYSYGQP